MPVDLSNKDELMHIGQPRRSGRYPWGSGENPYQRSGDFLSRIKELEGEGLTQRAIADAMGLRSTTELRTKMSAAKNLRRRIDVARAEGLKARGMGNSEIARQMGLPSESSVRALLDERAKARMNAALETSNILKKEVDAKGMIDVGKGVELHLNVSRERLKEALYMLELEGYNVFGGRFAQITNPNSNQQTTRQVLAKPGVDHREMFEDGGSRIGTIDYKSSDGGLTFHSTRLVPPQSMDSKRIQIRYAEDGGSQKDGVIELRRNVPDLDLGTSRYAQVRMLVDNNRYMKGMALYSDNMPQGIDVIYNTVKPRGTPASDVFKKTTGDPDNPFGASIKRGGQSRYTDSNGQERLSIINKTSEEGDWGQWADRLSSQFLSKQKPDLIQRQLNEAIINKRAEFESIQELTNPTIRKRLLQSFADGCDAAAVDLHAAALPRQRYQVALPVTSMKDTEVFAPNFRNGEQVALVRYPHEGTFQIPIVTVNNKQAEGRRVIGADAKDAIGFNSRVAERLSGADFDGDTIQVIPINDRIRITSTSALEGLQGFDARMSYPERPGMRVMKEGVQKQTEMGKISNLITDMTIQGATNEELARATRHSMTVIDAPKHRLDYTRSADENGITALRNKYQRRPDPTKRSGYAQGAATLISRAGGKVDAIRTVGQPRIDRETGELIRNRPVVTYIDKRTGKERVRTEPSTQMAETRDARTLSSGTVVETFYASYANTMKAMANRARKEMISTPTTPASPSAKRLYAREVERLRSAVQVAEMNAPREREALALATSVVRSKRQDNPGMSREEIKKVSARAMDDARASVGAKRSTITISDREWEAIQAGAVSTSMLTQILNNTDIDLLKERAMPRDRPSVTAAVLGRMTSMQAAGYTLAEIADALGLSPTTVSNHLN